MSALLAFSRSIDALSTLVGRAVMWLVLAAVLISAGNALIRYIFDMSSNAWLEVQWYLFSGIFLLAAGYTLKHQEHIRVDVVYNLFPRRTQVWIDIFGTIVFFLPATIVLGWLSGPFFLDFWISQEVSSNAGGLIRWPVVILLPIGFALLLLQGISELIKRIAYLSGHGPDPTPRKSEVESEVAAHLAQVEGERP